MKAVFMLVLLTACSEERVLSESCPEGGCPIALHQPGIADPGSDNFHAKLLRETNWDFAKCQKCHGEDFAGGKSGASCLKCHAQAPTACVTCHRDNNRSATHAVHLAASLDCSECHTKPQAWDDPGHIIDDSPPAEVNFGAKAALTLPGADRAGPPAWDGQKCSNVYCHGGGLHAGGGANTQPSWTQAAAGGCTGCHAAPPPSHARNDCATCHPTNAPHIDGSLQIGRSNDCSGCHGSASSPAPPMDLAGNMFTTAIGVGAHQAHLLAPSGLRGPIPCETCHVVPATITAVGHLDAAPADVRPELGWNRDSQTCTTWCHRDARPPWTSHGLVVCGSCHGAPPTDANHNAQMTVTTCVNCHVGTHMNGVLDGH